MWRVMRPIYPHSKKARNVNVDGWGKSVIEVDEIVNQDLFVSASFKISDIIPILKEVWTVLIRGEYPVMT